MQKVCFTDFFSTSILNSNTTNFYMKNIVYVSMQNSLTEMINKVKEEINETSF